MVEKIIVYRARVQSQKDSTTERGDYVQVYQADVSVPAGQYNFGSERKYVEDRFIAIGWQHPEAHAAFRVIVGRPKDTLRTYIVESRDVQAVLLKDMALIT